MRAATRIAFLLPLTALALAGAGCDSGKSGEPTAKPPAGTGTTPAAGAPTPPATSGPPAAVGNAAADSGVDLRAIDWANARLSLPASTRCPSPVRFTGHKARIKDFEYWIVGGEQRPAYGDLDGDGRDEAVVPLNCGNGGDGTDHLVVFAADGDHARPVTSISTQHLVSFAGHTVENGKLVATLRQSPIAPKPQTQVRTYRLRGGALVQIAGPEQFTW